MGKLIVILTALLLTASCTTAKRCARLYPPQTFRDSIYIERIDTVNISLPGDTLTLEVPIDCPDATYEAENGKLKQTITILNRRLSSVVTLRPDTVRVYTTKTVTVTKEVKVPDPVRYVPKYVKILAGLGGLGLLLAVWKIVKIFV